LIGDGCIINLNVSVLFSLSQDQVNFNNAQCDARARNPSLLRYRARGPNRVRGFQVCKSSIFNSAGVCEFAM